LTREIFIDFNEMVSKGNDRHSCHSQRCCFFFTSYRKYRNRYKNAI